MSSIEFTYQGIGKLIVAGKLRVPVNQREYAWDEEHVTAFCNDISDAIIERKAAYFLGTVVLTRAPDGFLEVVDGQQRLATTTMLFAVLRDMFHGLDEVRLVSALEKEFLFGLDIDSEEDIPKLQLNTRDHEYFLNQVLASPKDEKRSLKNPKNMPSNAKIKDASAALRRYLEESTKTLTPLSKKAMLKDWLAYLTDKANVIVLSVPDDVNAYVMFETLNDRGLRVSQADLVKNYLFGQAGNRLQEAQAKWASMIRSLEIVDKEDTAIDYLRLLSTIINGLTRERQVFERIKAKTNSPHKAIVFLEVVDSFSIDYVAMLTPDHWKWSDYPQSIRRSVATLNLLGSTQIRHLMLAVAHHFNKDETAKTFRLFVDWIVRLYIAGSGRVGRVESVYASLAHNIHNKTEIKTAKGLAERMSPNLANDSDFEKAFAIARVGKSKLARYYLDSLERSLAGQEAPDLVPNEDTKAVNLEHVMPFNPGNVEHTFADVDVGNDIASYVTRIGNLVLLNARQNSLAGNEGYAIKRPILAGSPFQLTKEVSENASWGPAEIDARQLKLAKLAVKTWSMREL